VQQGHAVTGPGQNDWLTLLQTARHDGGNPSFRVIAQESGVSLAAVAAIFNGQSRPKRENLIKLVDAVCLDGHRAVEIIQLFDASSEQRSAGQPAERDNELATAIGELAGAIVYLADAIKGHNRPLP
jgi:transcriptional regulator with XRE-family HTH domain